MLFHTILLNSLGLFDLGFTPISKSADGVLMDTMGDWKF